MDKKFKESLLKEHEELKSMAFRKDPDSSTIIQRELYYDRFCSHLRRVCHYICGMDLAGSEIYKKDFWWYSNTFQLLFNATWVREDLMLSRREELAFIDSYMELLLNSIHRIILTGKVNYVVYANVKKGRLIEYREYKKESDKWIGQSYVKVAKRL